MKAYPVTVLCRVMVSTIIMLRSVVDIARSEEERIKSPEAKPACLEVFLRARIHKLGILRPEPEELG
jgi:hypothetical protein